MPSTLRAIDVGPSEASISSAAAISSAATATATASLSTTYHSNNTILLPSLEQRLQTPTLMHAVAAAASVSTKSGTSTSHSPISLSPASSSSSPSASSSFTLLGSEINSSTSLTSISYVASVVVSNFLPLTSASSLSPGDDLTSVNDTKYSAASSYTSSTGALAPLSTTTSSSSSSLSSSASSTGDSLSSASSASTVLAASTSAFYPSYSPPVVESLVASSAEDFSNNFRDLSFDIFDDNDNDLFGSPMAFDASENGLWNGRFVPPPPRPPFFVDEPVLSDGLTTCDLCSWAMPTKSTFIFEGTMEKASELGWPLTLTIVSILSAILGAIIMIAVVKCRRKKTSHQRTDTHVQWWSRNKRPNGNNNHLRRSNIYTAHPVDSIRGLQQPNSLSASSSMTAMTTAMAVGTAPVAASTAAVASATLPFYHHGQQTTHMHNHQQQYEQFHQQQQHHFEHEHEYHQPQELQLQLQQKQEQHHHHQQQQQQQNHQTSLYHTHSHHPQLLHAHGPLHQHQHSATSMSSTSTSSMPSLSCMMPLQRQIPEQIQQMPTSVSANTAIASQPQHVHVQHQLQHQNQHHQQHHPHQQQEQEQSQSPDLHHDNLFHWPTAATSSIVTS